MSHRDELIQRFVWNSGGYGLGACAVGNSLLWGLDRPDKDHPDLVSTVFLCGSPDKYTEAELEQLKHFADKRDAEYDRMFNWRRGCNAILFDKLETGAWLRKRLTWDHGPMVSPTLEQAIAVFNRV